MSEFRLPDGKYTSSASRLSREWARIYKPICKELGVKVIGFDPGISFRYNDDDGYFTLPTSIAIKIRDLITRTE